MREDSPGLTGSLDNSSTQHPIVRHQAVCQSQSRRRAVPDLYFVWISIFLEYLALSKMERQNQTKMFFQTKDEWMQRNKRKIFIS